MKGVSVIIPCYNSERTIAQCVESVLSQKTSMPLEIIIVDDGSANNIKYHIPEYGNVYIINKQNGGVASARNLGVKFSNFDYIAFLDSDDVWLANKLRIQIEIVKSKGYRFIGTGWSGGFCSGGQILHVRKCLLPLKWGPHMSTILMEKKLFNDINGFDEKMRYAEDGDFLLKIADMDSIRILTTKLVENDIGKDFAFQSGLSSNGMAMLSGEIKSVRMHFGGFMSYLYIFIMFVKYLKRVALIKIKHLNVVATSC